MGLWEETVGTSESPGAQEAVLGMDLGTSECKVCLVSAAGEVIRAVREGYPTHCGGAGAAMGSAFPVYVRAQAQLGPLYHEGWLTAS